MCKISIYLILCAVIFGLTDCTTSFDQRQTGDFNVQIGLKNIQLLALLKGGNEEYVDYDYAYDYSEMTIKPQNGTTPKPLNVTTTHTQYNVTTSIPLADNTTEQSVTSTNHFINGTEQRNNSTELTTHATESNINATAEVAESINNQTGNLVATNYSVPITTRKVEDAPTTISPDVTIDASAAPVVPHTNCRRGFTQNSQGKCEYKGHGTTNALRRIVKLAQKIKIGRGYKGT